MSLRFLTWPTRRSSYNQLKRNCRYFPGAPQEFILDMFSLRSLLHIQIETLGRLLDMSHVQEEVLQICIFMYYVILYIMYYI